MSDSAAVLEIPEQYQELAAGLASADPQLKSAALIRLKDEFGWDFTGKSYPDWLQYLLTIHS